MKEAPPQISITKVQPISLWQLLLLYLRIGLTGIGPSFFTETNKYLVKDRRWISEEDFINGLALAQLLPGATYVSLTVYIGYKLRGTSGAFTCFFAFLLPPFGIMMLFSYIYFYLGSLTQISIIFKGVALILAGLLPYALMEIRKSTVTDYRGWIIAIGAAGLMVYYSNIFTVLFMAIVAGILLYYPTLKRQNMTTDSGGNLRLGIGLVKIPIKLMVMLVAGLVTIVFAVSFNPLLLLLGSIFFKMGAFLFGGGTLMIPFMQQEVVTHYNWLTMDEFLVGIALGQVTPGPYLITATFVGYKVAGVSGAIVATLGIFLPSLFLVMATAEIHQKIKHNLWVSAAIKGIVASFTGMMFVVAVGVVRHSVVDIPSALIILPVFAMLLFSKLDTIWVVIGGTAIYWLLNALAKGLI
ncbi:chromate efflux transporter [Clostridium pasteurianum]|uniref:Chromate transporter, chromate ion transporter family n=1 Tax=Clostridium pasteurianum BC1 TaxID=86416 RepID=R4K1B8_CLOPA|nr:chromate efflux transporter [Clostridium pasteurianum]AGK96368.1 chromate transporter, chromate ion transporter family [Clostridium pasteurianum BC1]